VQQTKRSHRYVLSANHEFAGSGCQHRTVSVVWTAQTSRAQYIMAKYLSGCVAVWNPSKPPRRFSLGDLYLSYFFFLFLCFIQKIMQPNSIVTNYILKHNFFKKNIVLFSMLPSCHMIFPLPPHNIVMRVVPLEFVLCRSYLFKIKIIIYLQLY